MSVSLCLKLGEQEIFMNPEKVLHADIPAYTTIPAVHRDKKMYYREFGGVVDKEYPPNGSEPVVLLWLRTFYWNESALELDGQFTHLAQDERVLGYCFNNRYYIAIDNERNEIVHWSKTAKKKGNA